MKAFIKDIFNQLRETPQRPDYHPEGDVFKHTAFVVDGLRKRQTRFSMDEINALMWVGLFHDIGKIDTTKRHEKHGHWTAYGHDKVSAKYVDALKCLIPNSVNTGLVRWLVLNHMKIKFIDEMSASKVKTMKREARSFDEDAWAMLEAFNEADDMLAYMEETTEDNRLHALESFESWVETLLENASDGMFKTTGEPKGDLVLVRGVPGSGKTTFSGLLNPDVRVSADDFFTDENGNYNFDASNLSVAHAWCQNQVFEAMRDGENVIVVDNTFTQTWEMAYYFQVASMNNYRVHSLIKENRHGGESVHGVPEKHVDRMKDRFNVRL